jgi:hypothetical protein
MSISDDSLSNTCNWKLNPSEIRLYKAIGKGFEVVRIFFGFFCFIFIFYFIFYFFFFFR